MNISITTPLIEVEALRTYEKVEHLLPQVKSKLQRLQSLVRAVDMEVLTANQELKFLKNESRTNLLSKLFKNKEKNQLQQKAEEARKRSKDLHANLSHLQDIVDYTPQTPLERDCILRELRLRKKSLQEQRREITQVAYGPRLRRIETPALPAGVDPQAFERRRARYVREAERLPGEDAETALQRQLAQVESALQWVESFPES